MSAAQPLDGESLSRWILVYLATIIGEPADSLDGADPLSEYDLDSIDAVTMAIELEKTFKFGVHPETFMKQAASVDEIVSSLL
ncbi:acyl carrier protein [Pseudophaeobacter sp.]|uniref:acyl carrier protein n=1 Tax=Pseudophaeobacter sp. TaxID=1971739 RepID=UPI0032633DD4